jgi:hypothetical protein
MALLAPGRGPDFRRGSGNGVGEAARRAEGGGKTEVQCTPTDRSAAVVTSRPVCRLCGVYRSLYRPELPKTAVLP